MYSINWVYLSVLICNTILSRLYRPGVSSSCPIIHLYLVASQLIDLLAV